VLNCKRGRPYKTTNLIVNFKAFLQLNKEQFSKSRYLKLIRLLVKGVFKVIKAFNILKGVYIFNFKFINRIKLKDDTLFIKLKLII
jgi:hypothetical protein